MIYDNTFMFYLRSLVAQHIGKQKFLRIGAGGGTVGHTTITMMMVVKQRPSWFIAFSQSIGIIICFLCVLSVARSSIPIPQQHSRTNSDSFLLIVWCAPTTRNRDLVSLYLDLESFMLTNMEDLDCLGVYSMNRCMRGRRGEVWFHHFWGH